MTCPLCDSAMVADDNYGKYRCPRCDYTSTFEEDYEDDEYAPTVSPH